MDRGFLLDIAFILIGTKIFGLITRKVELPQVVGALIAGVLMGPAVFNIVSETNFLNNIAELGVIVIMFNAGLESNVKELKSMSLKLIIIASCGVIIPLIGGFLVACIYNFDFITNSKVLMENIFVGMVLTATSVSITVETLKEMGKLSSGIASVITGAAIVDDIIGVVLLTFLISFSDKSIHMGTILIKILLFFIFVFIIGYFGSKLFNKWSEKDDIDRRRFVIGSFVICLILA